MSLARSMTIRSGDYVIGKDERGHERAGFFERLDEFHTQVAFVWVHVGRGMAQLRGVLAETLERSFREPTMNRFTYWRPREGGLVELRTSTYMEAGGDIL